MAVKLDDVLARVAGGAFEVEQQAVIERISGSIDDRDEMRLPGREVLWKFEGQSGDWERLRAGNSHHADGGLAECGGDGGDGVCEHRRW